VEQYTQILKSLSDPTRARILGLLLDAGTELCVCGSSIASLHGALGQLTEALPDLPQETGALLRPVLARGAEHTTPEEYDCLECRVCWSANALNFAAFAFQS